MIKVSTGRKIILKAIDGIGRFLFTRHINVERNAEKLTEKQNVKKILILEFWGLGDLVTISSVLATLKKEFPYAKVFLLSKEFASQLLKFNNSVDEYFFYDFPWTKHKDKYKIWQWKWRELIQLTKKLKKEKFDLILDARGDLRNNLLSFLINGRKRVGYDFTGGSYFLTDLVPVDNSHPHRIEEWGNILAYLNIQFEDLSPQIFISEDEEKWAESFLCSNGISERDIVIGIHPGARIKKRCWSLKKFSQLAESLYDNLNAKIIVFVEPGGYGKNITIDAPYISGKFSLRELIALISKLDLFICNDAGPMHIATAVKTCLVAIFGPGEPLWLGPYGHRNRVVIKKGYKCRPCYDYCRYNKFLCLEKITVGDVLKAVIEKLIDIGKYPFAKDSKIKTKYKETITERINILYFLPSTIPFAEGGKIFNLVNSFSRNSNVEVVTQTESQVLSKLLMNKVFLQCGNGNCYIDYVPVRQIKPSFFEKLFFGSSFLCRYATYILVRSLARKINDRIMMDTVDIIHSGAGVSPVLTLAAYRFAENSKIPFIFDANNCLEQGEALQKIYLGICRKSDALIALTENEKQKFIQFGVDKNKIHVIGIEPNISEKYNWNNIANLTEQVYQSLL